MEADLHSLYFCARGVELGEVMPLIDGVVPTHSPPEFLEDCIIWELNQGRLILAIERGPQLYLRLRLEGFRLVDSLGLRFGKISGVRSYLRNGYQSWDGSFFANPGTQPGDGPSEKAPTLGFAMTALLPAEGTGALVIGFTRHDRFQNRLRFGGDKDAMTLDIETLIDRVAHDGIIEAEPLILFDGDAVEESLRIWSRAVAAESPLPPRIPSKRITGWCSWYNLYAAIDETVIREHLAAAVAFRDRRNVPLDIFQIDDGFTPEMGDWLDVKPQFPHGMKRLLTDIAAAGFIPGLWIAPFMVGNRSRLFAEHPDWVVREAATGAPLVQMAFYGEFRWHKRSEEYYILDITHPGAEAWMREVFRAWVTQWGAGYLKTDFMFFGAEYGPDRAIWHEPGLSRIAIWRRMATLIREEIGEALWLGCGCPLWASVGLVDAVRIGRDVGIKWSGEQSGESLLRDQATRNHAAGVLWQADPDCILLRDKYHDLTDDQVRGLALLAGLSGGVLMTSDKFDELAPERAELFDRLAGLDIAQCDFPSLGSDSSNIVQRVLLQDGSRIDHVLDPATGASSYSEHTGQCSP